MENITNPESNSNVNTNHPVYREARDYFRRGYFSIDVLLNHRDMQLGILADGDADDVEHFNARHRLAALERAIAESVRPLSLNGRQRYRERDRLRLLVKERTDVPELLLELGHELVKVGMSKGRKELAGSCPLCGGTDRFRVWSGPDGRAWCRQCNWKPDALEVVQFLVPGCEEFPMAVDFLAHRIGVA
jgi:hypothetical protein